MKACKGEKRIDIAEPPASQAATRELTVANIIFKRITSKGMKISILIPSYNRVDSLERCLQAILGQHRMPDEVVLAVRPQDTLTLDLAQRWMERLPIHVTPVETPGQVNALNAGIAAAEGEIIAITDDDTAPGQRWLEKIESWFQADSRAGGVGGRDTVHQNGRALQDNAKLVGRIQFFGRIVGNHHLGFGPARKVHFLKGANMSYRRAAIAQSTFDRRLRGGGAQVSNDLAFSLAMFSRGWNLIYDPEVQVDHFPAPRTNGHGRGELSCLTVENETFNLYLSLRTSLPRGFGRTMACNWQTLLGTRGRPGIAYYLVAWARGHGMVQLCKAASRGRKQARQVASQSSSDRSPQTAGESA